MLLHDIS